MRLIATTLLLLAAACGGTSAGPTGNADAGQTTPPPPAPDGLTAVGGLGQISLAWNAVSGATGYTVLRGEAAGGAKTQLATPSGGAFVDTGLANGKTEFYVIRAVGAGGTSGDSTEVSATTDAQAAPSGLVATPANASVALSWTAAAGATSYKIRRSTDGVAAAQIGTSTSTTFSDTSVRNGLVYQYTVIAVGTLGDSGESSSMLAQPFRQLCISDFTRTKLFVLNAERPVDSAPTKTSGSLTGLDAFQIAIDVDPAHGELFSANFVLDTITTHAANANGNIAPLRTLGGFIAPSAVAYDPANDQLVVGDITGITTFARTATDHAASIRHLAMPGVPRNVLLTGATHGDRMIVNDGGARLLVHRRTDSDSAAPGAIITSPAFSNAIITGYDPVSDEVLVGTEIDTTALVLAFPATGNGSISPSRTLTVDLPNLITPVALSVDAVNGLLRVVDSNGGLYTFPRDFGANATLAPTSILTGPHTGLPLQEVAAGAFDPVHGTVATTERRQILVFDATASGDTAPLSVIGPASSGILNPGGLSFDKSRGELLVANANLVAGTISVFAAPGDAAPARSLQIGASASSIADIALDAAHGELIVAPGAARQIPIYARDAAGSTPPLRTIGGGNTLLGHVNSVAIDAAADAIVSSEFNLGAPGVIHRYARSFTDGNEAPLTSLSGAKTGFDTPGTLFVDDLHHELLVTATDGVLVFDLSADGDVAPIRKLSVDGGAAVILVDPVADELFLVTGNSELQVFSRTASGTDAPLRELLDRSGQITPLRMAICN